MRIRLQGIERKGHKLLRVRKKYLYCIVRSTSVSSQVAKIQIGTRKVPANADVDAVPQMMWD
jgi:hypothetical protein